MEIKPRVKLARCPHCQSTFEITDEDMQQAFGAVRCGECMKIFNAAYHLIDPAALSTATADAEPETAEPQSDQQIPTLHGFQAQAPANSAPFPAFLIGRPATEDEPEPEPEIRLHASSATEEPDPRDLRHPLDNKPDDDRITATASHEAALVTEARPQPRQTHKTARPPVHKWLPALLLVPLLAVGLYWLLGSQGSNQQQYQITDIRLAPADSPQQMEVHFQLNNTGNNNLPLPGLAIELLNLSAQPVATEHLTPDQVSRNLAVLAPGSTHALTVTVKRPTTFVQSARIQPLSP